MGQVIIISGLYLLLHILCGILSYGWTFAFEQRKWPTLANRRREMDRQHAWVAAWYGPIAVIIFAFNGAYRHGILFRSPPPRPMKTLHIPSSERFFWAKAHCIFMIEKKKHDVFLNVYLHHVMGDADVTDYGDSLESQCSIDELLYVRSNAFTIIPNVPQKEAIKRIAIKWIKDGIYEAFEWQTGDSSGDDTKDDTKLVESFYLSASPVRTKKEIRAMTIHVFPRDR